MRVHGYLMGCLALALAGGCQTLNDLGEIDAPPPTVPESFQSLGRLPGIDPTFYAYTYYKGTVTQIYQFSVTDTTASAIDALKELGYREVRVGQQGAHVRIDAITSDGRPAEVTIEPQQDLSRLNVRIGGCGDEPVSKALIDRIAMNMGTVPRTIIPLDKTLARRSAMTTRRAPAGYSGPLAVSIPDPTPPGALDVVPVPPAPDENGSSPFRPGSRTTEPPEPHVRPG